MRADSTAGWQDVQCGGLRLTWVRGVPLAGEVLGNWDPLLQFLEPIKDYVDSCGYGLGLVVDHQKPVVWQDIPTLSINRQVT